MKAPLEFSLSTFARTGPLPVVSKSFLSSYKLLALVSALGRFSGLSSRLLSPAGPTPREFTVHLGPRPSTSTRIVSGINHFACIMSKYLSLFGPLPASYCYSLGGPSGLMPALNAAFSALWLFHHGLCLHLSATVSATLRPSRLGLKAPAFP